MRLLPCGDRALLVDPGEDVPAVALAAALREAVGPGVPVVPGARTVLVPLLPGGRDATAAVVAAAVQLVRSSAAAALDASEVVLDVRYDGVDLDDAARRLGVGVDDVVALHTGASYTVAFCGFAPGFAYLSGLPAPLQLPRLDAPRTRVPAGAVAVAGGWAGVYPRPSPGGWRLLGTTDAPLWDLQRDPPALLVPGTRVRFRAVGR